MIGDFASNRFITLTWPVGTTALTWYVRPGGDDNNDGTTALTAFATLARALREVPLYGANQPTIIDVTGMTIAVAELLQLGGGALGATINTYAAPVVPDLPNRRQVQLVADLTEVRAFTVTAQADDGITGLATLTVAEAIGPNEIDDLLMLDGSGHLGPVVEYTTGAGPNTIYVASTAAFDAAVSAYAPGASLTYGVTAQGLDGAIHLNALADWSFRGLSLASTDDAKQAAITVWAHQPVDFYACTLNGLHTAGGAAPVTLYGCVVRNQGLIVEGGASLLLQNVFGRGLTMTCARGHATLDQVVFDACSPFGAGAGSSSSQFSAEITRAEVRNGTGAGIKCLFGTWALSNLRCTDNFGSGVYVLGALEVAMTAVVGTGNDYGLECIRNASVTTDSTTAVTGGSGDVYLGNAGTFAWADFSPVLPETDIEQLVRVFHQGGV